MNQTKKWLIISAIIFTLGEFALNLYYIISYFITAPELRNTAVYFVVFYFIDLFTGVAVAVLLIMSIWGNGKYFRQRYGLYMAALVISLVTNLFAVSTILLIITIFVSDWVWIKPKKEKPENVVVEFPSKEERIAQLRKQREEGQITDEQFQEELTKLL